MSTNSKNQDSPIAKQTRAQAQSGEQRFSVRSGYAYELGNTDTFKRITELEIAIGPNPLEGLEKKKLYFALKRVADIAFSVIFFILFWWLYVLVAILVKIDDPKGPVLFKQTRIGKDGKPFKMYKFRSMCVDAEQRLGELKDLNEKTGPVFKIADDPRITKVGRWLRKLSLDELPQFFNVLKGDISIVGPRPALPNEVATYTPYQRQRLAVKPGITCYWQTRRNRDSITFEEWVDLDLLYIKNCNVWADIKLIIQTVGVVMTAQGS
ncbi:sugar transferase [Anaerotardibacter muris]|uniref:sugar transferase n=1 Tax=Anaerotardibacter muris TaxID=2941505 RepID=UPI00203C679F|nr:sugar transferase [Anaerotardibacter muris]